MIRQFVRAFRAYWSVEAIAARMERLSARLRSWPWPPGEDPRQKIPPPERRRPPSKQSASPPPRPAPRTAWPQPTGVEVSVDDAEQPGAVRTWRVAGPAGTRWVRGRTWPEVLELYYEALARGSMRGVVPSDPIVGGIRRVKKP